MKKTRHRRGSSAEKDAASKSGKVCPSNGLPYLNTPEELAAYAKKHGRKGLTIENAVERFRPVWDEETNGPIEYWFDVSLGSPQFASLICTVCKGPYQNGVHKLSLKSTDYCLSCSRQEQGRVRLEQSFGHLYPEYKYVKGPSGSFCDEDTRANPYNTPPGSDKTFYRDCLDCGADQVPFLPCGLFGPYKTGCSVCAGRTVRPGINDVASTSYGPEFIRNLKDPEKDATQTGKGASDRCEWKCSMCGHVWQSTAASRDTGYGCYRCKKGIPKDEKRSRAEKALLKEFFPQVKESYETWARHPEFQLLIPMQGAEELPENVGKRVREAILTGVLSPDKEGLETLEKIAKADAAQAGGEKSAIVKVPPPKPEKSTLDPVNISDKDFLAGVDVFTSGKFEEAAKKTQKRKSRGETKQVWPMPDCLAMELFYDHPRTYIWAKIRNDEDFGRKPNPKKLLKEVFDGTKNLPLTQKALKRFTDMWEEVEKYEPHPMFKR